MWIKASLAEMLAPPAGTGFVAAVSLYAFLLKDTCLLCSPGPEEAGVFVQVFKVPLK